MATAISNVSCKPSRETRELVFLPATASGIADAAIPPHEPGFAEQYRALALASTALDVLLNVRTPVPDAYRRIGNPAQHLTNSEIEYCANAL